MLELFTCASSALGGGHDESIYDTFMSHLPAVLTAFTQAVNMPSKMVAPVYDQKRHSSSTMSQDEQATEPLRAASPSVTSHGVALHGAESGSDTPHGAPPPRAALHGAASLDDTPHGTAPHGAAPHGAAPVPSDTVTGALQRRSSPARSSAPSHPTR